MSMLTVITSTLLCYLACALGGAALALLAFDWPGDE